jgi:hypothetical protein
MPKSRATPENAQFSQQISLEKKDDKEREGEGKNQPPKKNH